ncbi:unnamed protein product [Vitrella brassicaformis CCMP3155]|uniref:Nicotinamide-nucleotide adenylyltransferase n=1 Tax=Vitrella brassicaformis (strain CCMP3155) TaxID=1169540 RepID=A0A0G4FK66_VITBC|nr:unnamed protein product [Vitrella brassicaformis CCMP3155]|mmetsp:Transcript_12199/g.35312  ORF Transcript_12199/g.35312 Transcript_12199/m.35312 type:complete len:220 (+) Transcript_12199:191-850(+)|eukprot:CEM14170.1 unnamed protein product [Vitrella brassicaformis CCMP3155]
MNANSKKRVGVFGGSFDPITVGHIMTAAQVLHCGSVDEVWIVPCGNRPDKKTTGAARHRLEMCRRAVEASFSHDFPIKVMSTEVDHGQFIPSYELMKRYASEHPSIDFWLIIGSDLVTTLQKWQHGPLLMKECRFLVVPRQGAETTPADPRWPPGITYRCLEDDAKAGELDLFVTDISSTALRARLGRPMGRERLCEGLTPLCVLEYIREHGLYRGERL